MPDAAPLVDLGGHVLVLELKLRTGEPRLALRPGQIARPGNVGQVAQLVNVRLQRRGLVAANMAAVAKLPRPKPIATSSSGGVVYRITFHIPSPSQVRQGRAWGGQAGPVPGRVALFPLAGTWAKYPHQGTGVNSGENVETIADLLDQAKTRAQIGTDSALGTRLGKSRQTVSQWRSGVRIPEDDDVIRLAHLAAIDAGACLVLAQAARSRGEVARAWTALAKKLGLAAAVMLCVVAPHENAFIPGVSASELPASASYVLVLMILTALAAWSKTRPEAPR